MRYEKYAFILILVHQTCVKRILDLGASLSFENMFQTNNSQLSCILPFVVQRIQDGITTHGR